MIFKETVMSRAPPWMRQDKLVGVVDWEVDITEVNDYYGLMCCMPRQPIQLWTIVTYSGLTPNYTYKIRISAFEDMPLRQIKVYDEDDNLLTNKRYSDINITTEDLITIEDKDSDTFYVKVYYYGFNNPVEKGFPQDSDATDSKYLPSSGLDRISQSYGVFRRLNYRTDITEEELPYTYPRGYPYPIEQDYPLEVRLLSEYAVRDEVINYVDLEDIYENHVMRIIPKNYNTIYTLNIVSYQNVVMVRNLADNTEEMHSGDTLDEIMDEINSNSDIIEAELLEVD